MGGALSLSLGTGLLEDPALFAVRLVTSAQPASAAATAPTLQSGALDLLSFSVASSAPLLSMLQCAPARPPPHCCPLLPSRLLLPLPAQPRHPRPQPLPTLPLPLPQPLPQALRTVQGNWPTGAGSARGEGRQERPPLGPPVGSCVGPLERPVQSG